MGGWMEGGTRRLGWVLRSVTGLQVGVRVGVRAERVRSGQVNVQAYLTQPSSAQLSSVTLSRHIYPSPYLPTSLTRLKRLGIYIYIYS
jgi:hypothetical protein